MQTARMPIGSPHRHKRQKPQLVTRELKLVAHMAEHWFRQFARRFNFPDNYTTLDLETSGLNPEVQLTCTYGYTVVRDRQPIETREVILDWTKHPDVDQLELQRDLQRAARAMKLQGKVLHHTYEYLRRYGIDAIQALEDLLTLVETAENNQEILVLHNGWAFDVEFMKAAFHNWLRVKWEFHPNLVYDSGIIEKASQLPEVYSPLPMVDESMQDWARRIYSIRAPIKWNLDHHCDTKYGLLRKANVVPGDMHKSGTDSLVLHYLVEEHRRLAELIDQFHNDDNEVVMPYE